MSEPGGDGLTQTKLSAFFSAPKLRERFAESDVPRGGISRDNSSASDTLSQESDSQVRKRPSGEVERRQMLRLTARESKALLPGLLKTIPHAPPHGHLYTPPNPPKLKQRYCPEYLPVEIKILNADTLDTAIHVAICEQFMTVRDKKPVCVLNMANAHSAGGGWLNGALAQEEALCYRSSLSFSLKSRYYPLQDDQAIYSPTVVIFRDNLQQGHNILDLTSPDKLPIVSVISIAALCMPSSDRSGPLPKYRYSRDRELMKEKMRIVLRTAAFNGHRRLVLGALGCGAFLNPRDEVADCWAEVFTETEFKGGWWESICFAVIDDLNVGRMGNGNFGVFYRRLHGMQV